MAEKKLKSPGVRVPPHSTPATLPWEKMIHRKVIWLDSLAPIRRAAEVLCDQNIGCILVFNDRDQLIGILTDRDIACSVVAYDHAAEEPISEIMTPHPVVAEETDSIQKVIQLMEQSGIRRIPIIRSTSGHQKKFEKECFGMITLDDLIAFKMIDLESCSRIIQAQIQRKTKKHVKIQKTSPDWETLNQFYVRISERVEIPSQLLVPVTHTLLSSLVQRLHSTGAAHLISLLPQTLEEELLNMSPGPNRDITINSILNELISRFGIPEPQARAIVFNFFATLEELIHPEEIERIKSQLPEEFRALFIGTHRASGRDEGNVA